MIFSGITSICPLWGVYRRLNQTQVSTAAHCGLVGSGSKPKDCPGSLSLSNTSSGSTKPAGLGLLHMLITASAADCHASTSTLATLSKDGKVTSDHRSTKFV